MTWQTRFVPLGGGLNYDSAPMMVKPGQALLLLNYLPAIDGGYRRIAGYERFDGRPAPSDAGNDKAVREARRALIQAVPGQGPIRGVVEYAGKVLAFRDTVDGTSCCMYESSATGWKLKKTGLAPGGKYRFVVANFAGAAGTKKLYGVSGTHKGFQWDGSTWTDISTGMTDDRPRWVVEHSNHLFFGFSGGSVQHSGIGNPLTWTPITGAAELAVGDEITNMIVSHDLLVIYARNSIHMLAGRSAADWVLKSYDKEGGGLPDTARIVSSDVLALDDPGLIFLQAAQLYGDFTSSVQSRKVRPLLSGRQPVFALVSKRTGAYWLHFEDRSAVAGVFAGAELLGFGAARFAHSFTCGYVSEMPDGSEAVLVGTTDGYIMRMDTGTSFDGAPIQAIARLPFNSLGSPAQRKRFHKVSIEIDGPDSLDLAVMPDFDYGTRPASDYVMQFSGGGGFYDIDAFDQIVFDGGVVGVAEASIRGVGKNVGILIVHESADVAPFTLCVVGFYFTYRGQAR